MSDLNLTQMRQAWEQKTTPVPAKSGFVHPLLPVGSDYWPQHPSDRACNPFDNEAMQYEHPKD